MIHDLVCDSVISLTGFPWPWLHGANEKELILGGGILEALISYNVTIS